MDQLGEHISASRGVSRAARYVVVALFDQVHAQFSRRQWPAHVTVAPNFHTRASDDEVRSAVRQECESAAPIVEFGDRALFGPDGDVRVRLVLPGALNRLHEALAQRLEALPGFRADDPAYWRDGYRPHLTLGPAVTVGTDSPRAVTSIALVRLDGDVATVLDVIPVSPGSFIEFRTMSTEDALGVARLKVDWAQRDSRPSQAEIDEFAETLRSWILTQGANLVGVVAEDRGIIVGMAWMVLFERVPDFDDRRRLTADIQSVYVAPGWRGNRIGTRLVDWLCREADQRGIPRVLVTASVRSVALYERAGFTGSHLLLQRSAQPAAPPTRLSRAPR